MGFWNRKDIMYNVSDGWIDKQNVVYTRQLNIIHSLKRRKFSDAVQHGWNLRHYAKWNYSSHKKANTLLFHSCEISRVIKFVETESKMVVAMDWEGKLGGCSLMGRESVCRVKRILSWLYNDVKYS